MTRFNDDFFCFADSGRDALDGFDGAALGNASH
jgi:hypothetical protein